MKNAALLVLLWMVMTRPVMAQGEGGEKGVAPVQSPTVAQAVAAADTPALAAHTDNNPLPDAQAVRPKPPPYMPPDLPEPNGPLDEYWARQRPVPPYATPGGSGWEQQLNTFFDETVPRFGGWCVSRVRQDPVLTVPLLMFALVSTYFGLMFMALCAGVLRRWRASVRLSAERSLTRAERQKHMRNIMSDVVKHMQAKLQFETGYYSVAQPPPRRAPTPRPTDLS